ncbi:MAG: DNA repair protein RecN [Proteobacteria bacterium]|nr:DNA repair protein RecN [Pseudomonadota bacterium]
MLRELKITNLALIESLEIDFRNGLTVLTGETGAGKSIILQALHLLSGGRASTDWVRTGADSAVVEALFEVSSYRSEVPGILEDMGLASDDLVVIRRIILRNGKSRYYVNGGIATAGVVSRITEGLFSVASQHDHQQLLHPRYQLDFVDEVGELWHDREKLGALYEQWHRLGDELRTLQNSDRDKEQRRDFLAYQVREIEDARIYLPDDANLAEEKARLKASDDLLLLAKESSRFLEGEIHDKIGIVRKNIERMAALDKGLANAAEKIAGIGFELEDQAIVLRNYIGSISTDPAELEKVATRIDLLQQLKRKYGVSLEDVVKYGDQARKELSMLEVLDQRLDSLEREIAVIEKQLIAATESLSKERKKTAVELSKTIGIELKSLNFDQAILEIQFNDPPKDDLSQLSRAGWDRPVFMFSANPGEPAKPVAKIVSGGELSRVMLALKTILSRKDKVETVIFDEVDAGISGKTAEAVARKIKGLARHHQVLCITHFPQIASCADDHFVVAKNVKGARTHSNITHLLDGEREAELARMLDGDSATEKTFAYARELLVRNRADA